MNLSATIAKMRAAGMSSEAILVALECLVIDPVTPERSGAARRQAAYRDRVRERNALRNVDNGDVTSDVLVSPLVPPFPPAPPNPPIIPPSIHKTSRAKPSTAIADDWEPDGKTWKLAEDLGFTSQQAWDQLERMRDWAKSAGTKAHRADWNAAFRNWLKRTADDRRNRPQAPQRNSLQDSFAILDAVVDEAIRRSDGSGQEGGEKDAFGIPGLRKSAA